MAGVSGIKEHMEVIGADGVHVGTVDRVVGNRKDSGERGAPSKYSNASMASHPPQL